MPPQPAFSVDTINDKARKDLLALLEGVSTPSPHYLRIIMS